MKISTYKLQTIPAMMVVLAAITFSADAANLSNGDEQFLEKYQKIHAALAADDLSAAKSAAKDLGNQGSAVASAGSLKDARVGFEKLSARAKMLVSGRSGFYVVHCPMLKKDWVQTTETIANPYAGKEMPTCGEIKK